MKLAQSVQSGHFDFLRLGLFYLAIVGVFGFFAFRLFSLQVIDGPNYLEQAEENRISKVSTRAQRGIVYDRNGYVLARNVASYNVIVTPAYLPTYADDVWIAYHQVDKELELPDNADLALIGTVQEIYTELSKLIDVPVTAGDATNEEQVRGFKPCENDFGIAEVVYIANTNSPFEPVRVKCNVSREVAMTIQEKASLWPGVGVEIEPIRDYPTGALTAEIIGFLGPIPATQEEYYQRKGFVPGRDKVGYAGIEAYLQDLLGGTNGERLVEVDVAGKEMRDLTEPQVPIPGYNIELTIDTRLQNAAQTALQREMDGWNAYLNEKRMTNGVVAAMNPKTGEILALVSLPSYENNRMARLIPAYYYEQLSRDPNRPLFNHAISAEHPPGSVFKMAAALGILNEGIVTPEYKVEDPGKITILQKFSPNDPGSDRDYVCWEEAGHGMVDFLHGVAWSCDVYWYKVGGGYKDEVPEGLGIWRLGEYARAIGYGARSGIELPGEEDGLIPDPNWKRVNVGENWATGDTYIATMGQGYILSTPLQVLISTAVIANDGKYMQPTLVHRVLDSEGNVVKPFEPVLKWDLTKDPRIMIYDENMIPTGQYKVVEPWVIEKSQEGMRLVNIAGGTAEDVFADMEIPTAGKTGTAEYCDDTAQKKNLCSPGNWPTHSWYMAYAPYEDPEIAVAAFIYNGGEGASVAAPVVRAVMDAYFALKTTGTTGP